MDCDPLTLVQGAKCFECISEPDSVAVYLLCQWANGGGGGGGDQFEANDANQRVTTDDGKNIVLNI